MPDVRSSLLFGNDNSYDIGASGAQRPRDLYLGRSLIAFQAVTNAALASDTARDNLLVNGGFEIWQRGNGPFTALGARAADMWVVNQAGTDTFSVSRDTANVDVGSGACMAVTFTLGNGAGGSCIYQGNMTDLVPSIKGRTLSVSARVRTSTANAVRVALNNYYSTTNHFTYSSYHSGGGTYETLTATATMDATLSICQVLFFFTASCTAYLDNAMLVVGTVPADYAPLHPSDAQARCNTYYQGNPDNWVGSGVNWSTTEADSLYIFRGGKLGGNPSITLTAASAFQVRQGGTQVTPTSLSPNAPSPGALLILATCSGLTAGQGHVLYANAANAIVGEWNP